MARFFSRALRPLFVKAILETPAFILSSSRSYISQMRRSAFKENLLRILRTEITYESEYRPPSPPPTSFGSFSIESNPGEQWIRLRRKYSDTEDIKIDATMFDGAIPPKKPAAGGGEEKPRLHISFIMEVSKGDASGFVLQFLCSAWPDSFEVEKLCPVSRETSAARLFMGPNFKDLDDELQDAVLMYLEVRGVNDGFAEFLHEYMENKDKMEVIHWLKNVETYVKK